MSGPNTPQSQRTRVADLRKGQRVSRQVFLVESSNFKQTRAQKYFIQLALRDASGSIRAVRWEATEELYASFGVDDFVRVDGRVEEFQGQPQLIVDRVDRVDSGEVDFADFLPVSERDPEEMEKELHRFISEVRREDLRAWLLHTVKSPEIRPGLLRCPAGKALHHAWVGGLLEHTLSLLGLAQQVCRHYAELDRDVLYAAAIFHDIGKIEELSYTTNFQYTDVGQLVGHIAIGISLAEKKAAESGGVARELLLHVQHIIASHHGVPEHGAVKLPMTREAIVFHYLDNIDAKLSTLDIAERSLPPAAGDASASTGRWSDWQPHLGRRLWFPDAEPS